MIHYLLLDGDGGVSQRGCCPTEDEIPRQVGCIHQIIDPSDPRRPGAGRETSYREMRRIDYPGIGDQLDAIWKTIDRLGVPLSQEADLLLQQIRAVKDLYPKPTDR